MRKQIKRYILLSLGIIFLCIAVLYFCKDRLILHYSKQRIESLETKYQLKIDFVNFRTIGLSGVSIEGLTVVPISRDTLFKSGTIEVEIKPLKLLLGKLEISRIKADQLNVQLIKRDSLSNFDFWYKSAKDTLSTSDNRDFEKRTDRILDALFSLLPANADIRSLGISYYNAGHSLALEIPFIQVNDHHFSTEIRGVENGVTSRWICQGTLRNKIRQINAKLYAQNQDKIPLPFLEYRWQAKIEFDTLSFELAQEKYKSGISLTGKAKISGLSLFHQRISPENVSLNKGTIDYKINIGKNNIELDSATVITVNQLSFHPYLKAEKKEEWHFTISVNKNNFPANELFTALPHGLFDNLEGIETSGNLSFHFLFDLDMAHIDQLKFESTLDSHRFKILKYSTTNLSKMNGPFLYTAYEHNTPVRTFEVGLGNPNFRPLAAISPLLQMAVMQSEDGAFYGHNGFLPDCTREALIHDIKLQRFARGGSTISMQLVKNVFLNRNKNIARKLEEAIIVWLIEKNHITSKSRMYEVYLNIIEWGPLVYGANEAAHYYFDKESGNLSVNEAIFLACIIPRPKYAMTLFTDSLRLKPVLGSYYHNIAERLKIKGLLTAEEAATVKPDIEIKGAAKELFLKRRIGKTLYIENEEEDIE